LCPATSSAACGALKRLARCRAAGALTITPDQQVLVSGGGSCFRRYAFDFSLGIWALGTGKLNSGV
jgi:hypothetical protein